MKTKSPARLWIFAVLAAWIFDQLFWKHEPGISFPIFMALLSSGGVWLSWQEGRLPARASWAPLALIWVFAILSVLRQEPLTQGLSVMLALAMLSLAAMSWSGGRWWRYGIADYLANAVRLGLLGLAGPVSTFSTPEGEPAPASSRWGAYRPFLSIFLGLFLALPVVALLGGLLSEADLVFAQRIQGLLDLLKIENLPEYIFRMFYIVIGAYLIAGGLLYAFFRSQEEKLGDPQKPWPRPFLGWIEASTVLSSVNLLFGFFVVIQFQYFFGGRANINLEGFTYAEYARRGFGELVIVAALSLALFLGLSTITRREQGGQQRFFSGTGILLVLLVGMMLVSAFQRLVLYEQAYGFTRLRTYTFVFMFWLAPLLLVTVLLELRGRLRHFALAALLAALGFSLSLGLMNVDGFIARQNIARAAAGAKEVEGDFSSRVSLDASYLANLSDDALPVMFASLADEQLPLDVRQEIGGALACRRLLNAGRADPSWQSFHFSRYQGARLYQAHAAALDGYSTWREGYSSWVMVNGQPQPCSSNDWID